MRQVFADTGYWVALLNPKDDYQLGFSIKKCDRFCYYSG
jgi:hypothetical protein